MIRTMVIAMLLAAGTASANVYTLAGTVPKTEGGVVCGSPDSSIWHLIPDEIEKVEVWGVRCCDRYRSLVAEKFTHGMGGQKFTASFEAGGELWWLESVAIDDAGNRSCWGKALTIDDRPLYRVLLEASRTLPPLWRVVEDAKKR